MGHRHTPVQLGANRCRMIDGFHKPRLAARTVPLMGTVTTLLL